MSNDAGAEFSWGFAKTPEDRLAVFRFRYAVYVEEMHKQLALVDHSRKVITDDIDEYARILFVRAGHEIVGTVRSLNAGQYLPQSYQEWFEMDRFASFPLEKISFTSRMMVSATHRGGNVVGILLRNIYSAARDEGVCLDLIHCAPALVALYETLGYHRISNRIVETDVGQHLTMALVADDFEHLAAVRSLFSPVAKRYPSDPRHAAWFAEHFRDYMAPVSSRVVGVDTFIAQLGQRLASETGPLLDGISLEEIGAMLRQASIIRVAGGDFIVRKGETGSEIFVVLAGAVEARLTVNGATTILRTMGKGDVFGELAILGCGRRSADVVALDAIELLVLATDFLDRLTKEQPSLASQLFRNLSKVLAQRLLSKEDVVETGSPEPVI